MKILSFIVISLTVFLNCLQTYAMEADEAVKAPERGGGTWNSCRGSSIERALSGAPRANRVIEDPVRYTTDTLKRNPRGGGCNVIQHSRHNQSLAELPLQLSGTPFVCWGYIENGTLVLQEAADNNSGEGDLITVFLNPKILESEPKASSLTHQRFMESMERDIQRKVAAAVVGYDSEPGNEADQDSEESE